MIKVTHNYNNNWLYVFFRRKTTVAVDSISPAHVSQLQELKEESKSNSTQLVPLQMQQEQVQNQTYTAPRNDQSAFIRSSKMLSSTSDRYAPQVSWFVIIFFFLLFVKFLFDFNYRHVTSFTLRITSSDPTKITTRTTTILQLVLSNLPGLHLEPILTVARETVPFVLKLQPKPNDLITTMRRPLSSLKQPEQHHPGPNIGTRKRVFLRKVNHFPCNHWSSIRPNQLLPSHI